MKLIYEAVFLVYLGVFGALSPRVVAQPVNEIWKNSCAECHSQNAEDEAESDLTNQLDWLGTGDRALFDAVLAHDGTGLPKLADNRSGGDLSAAEAWALVNYLRELQDRARKDREEAPRPKAGGVFESEHHGYRIETVIGAGLDTPWSVDWMSDGRMLITERDGRLRVHDGEGAGAVVRGTPSVRAQGQGGMLDVAVLLGRDGQDDWVYLSYSHEIDGQGMTRIVRGKIRSAGRGLGWVNEELIWEADADDYVGGGLHFGCRVVFDGEGHVFFAIGERGRGADAQDLTRPNGKVHRLKLDGSVPSDNPFVGEGRGVYGSIWSYGHRNPQGLAFDDAGVLWDTEHGPRGGDEVNVVERGGNYGWPLVSFGMNYSGKPLEAPWAEVVGVDEEIVMPEFRWLPSIAACGLDMVTNRGRGMMFSKWRGDLLAGGLAGQTLERLRFVGGVIVEREELLRGIGRVRDVAVGPGGAVYVVLNDPNKVVRLVEAE